MKVWRRSGRRRQDGTGGQWDGWPSGLHAPCRGSVSELFLWMENSVVGTGSVSWAPLFLSISVVVLNLPIKCILTRIMNVWRDPGLLVVSLEFSLRIDNFTGYPLCWRLSVCLSVCLPLPPPSPNSFTQSPDKGWVPASSFRRGHADTTQKPSRTLSIKTEVLSRAPCCQGNHFLRFQNINISLPIICFLVRFFPAVTSSDHRGKHQ